ncbi:hypothetical protein C4K02_3970 [Pseudomonas synxantha]|nr:hypothetical protein C4K02_3970 [Pseudomonas synxantha]
MGVMSRLDLQQITQANFSAYRIKSLDLIDFLKLKPWTKTVKQNAHLSAT